MVLKDSTASKTLKRTSSTSGLISPPPAKTVVLESAIRRVTQQGFDFDMITRSHFGADVEMEPSQSRESSSTRASASGGEEVEEEEVEEEVEEELASGSRVIYVSNLDLTTVTADDVESIFGIYGDVVEVRLVSKKGAAFIQFEDRESAVKAVSEGRDLTCNGQHLNIELSKFEFLKKK